MSNYPIWRKATGLPTPRLELRWEETERGNWLCHYYLVLPLDELDCRGNAEDGEGERFTEWACLLGRTRVTGGRSPLRPDGSIDTPFRDGVHIKRDCKSLGGHLPMYAVCGAASMEIVEEPAP